MATKNDARAQREARARLRAYEERQHNHSTKISRRKADNVVISIVAIVAVLIAIGSQITFALTSQGSQADSSASTAAGVPDKSLAENRQWNGALTLAGVPLSFTLNGAAAPQAVASTVSLINKGFYTGTTCHRLTTEGIYVLQCGDPQGTGSGGPGYTYGPVENAPANNIYPAGTIAMARQGGNGNSMGSQFFIVYKDSTIPSDAAGGYTVIGNITSGLPQLITDVTSRGTTTNTGDGPPVVSALIQAITVK